VWLRAERNGSYDRIRLFKHHEELVDMKISPQSPQITLCVFPTIGVQGCITPRGRGSFLNPTGTCSRRSEDKDLI
jgi:hypothetical protein